MTAAAHRPLSLSLLTLLPRLLWSVNVKSQISSAAAALPTTTTTSCPPLSPSLLPSYLAPLSSLASWRFL